VNRKTVCLVEEAQLIGGKI